MNENLNLVEILKDCPKGTKLYSTIHGEVKYVGIKDKMDTYRIRFELEDGDISGITPDGRYYSYFNGECILFPSKDQRDWSKFTAPWYKKERFDPKTLKPFDKVLVRDGNARNWVCDFFSHIGEPYNIYMCISIVGGGFKQCIPYNDDTKHLVGTNKEAPEYYRYWED